MGGEDDVTDLSVGDCLEPIPRQQKVKTSEYLETGAYPVIDQGIAFVGGYVNEESLLYAGPLPVVIFGDHNRNIKLAKRPFAVGADGTQLLHPDHRFDVRYFYYALRALPLKNYGYERHFKYLKKEKVRQWPLVRQHRIASILSAYDNLIENNTRRIAILEEMARRIYEEWFVRFRFPGHESMRMVESELGSVPEGWRHTSLGESADIQWGDTTKTKASYTEDGYAAYSASGLDGRMGSFDFDRDGIVLSAIGARCGLTWYARGQWSCIKNTIRFWSSDSDRMCNEYLFFATMGMDFWPRRGAAQPFISLGDARACALVLPPKDLMNRFREFARPALELAGTLDHKNTNLRTTRDLLLPKLISGELNVSELSAPEAIAA